VTDLYRAQVAGRGVRLAVALDPAITTIVADQGRLRQLLHNLLTNSVEALEGQPDGQIAVATRLAAVDEAGLAEIVVEDNGPGFPRELVGQVFDPYVTTKARGTGLGLAIVRKIVEEHGGSIEADNRPEGGARVRIGLPVNESMRGQARREPRRPEPRRERA
jgi:C4-dicarboxylate-specific signal transduction histidine kinase